MEDPLNYYVLDNDEKILHFISIYHYFNINGFDLSHFAWVPVMGLSFVIFISSVGVMPLAFICSVEYLPPKVR